MARVCRKILQAGQRIRVLVVDDSVVIRRLVTHALEPEPDLEVVGFAANGGIALSRIPQVNPDVVTLDIEMPEMDGLETLRHLRREHPEIRVVMFSTLTERGAAITLEALALGADDYVAKVSNQGSLDRSLVRLREELVPKIRQFFFFSTAGSPKPPPPPAALPHPLWCAPRAVAIGVSTGGPNALGRVLPEFPADFPLPVLVVQHMPAMFTRLLAERLSASCRLPVHEAADGEIVAPGTILIAPGDFHMRVAPAAGAFRIRLDQSPPLNSCRPAVDALFASLAETYGAAVTAAVLTGMGQDGLRGAQLLKAGGACVIAQDEATSVVWGMPGAVVGAGLADAVLPLDQVTAAVLRQASEASCPR